MNKIKYLITLVLITLCIIPKSVLATGNISVSTSNINITKGNTGSFAITADNAAGRVDISSANSSVASVSASSIFLDMQSETITVTGNSVGTTTIKVLVSDGTTYDDEDITGKLYTINITVVEPSSNNKPNVNNNSNVNNNNNKSKNNKIKELTVEGYELTKVDENNYSLSLSNDVTSININAVLEDTKAKITGNGKRELQVGENIIELIVTSESGAKNKYIINILRKDGYYIEDLDKLLFDNNEIDINININQDTKISKEDIIKIKNSKKIIKLNYYDENNKLLYSWIVDGKKIDKEYEFLTSITNISEHIKEISLLSNYADGLYLNFKHNGDLPKGTKIKAYVGDKFTAQSMINIYHYNKENNSLELVKNNLIVNSEYIEFDIEHCSEYFLTMSNINIIQNNANSINIYMILSLIEIGIILLLILIIFAKKNQNKKSNTNFEMPKMNNNY